MNEPCSKTSSSTTSPSFIAISDVHLGLNLYTIPDLGDDLKRLFAESVQAAIATKVQYLVVVGDLLDTNKPTPALIRFINQQVEIAEAAGVRVVGIAGDHDKPVSSESWSRISGVRALEEVPQFAGCDYDDDPEVVMNHLRTRNNRELVHWIFLHGQVPVLWPFCSERKRLDLGSLPIYELYPRLQGVILGDIHSPMEGKLIENGREAYIGYCGSLGVTKSDELTGKTGMLHFDGTVLQRRPYPLGRDYIVIDITTKAKRGMEVEFYVEKYKKLEGRRPLFLVQYTADTADRLKEIAPLYTVGHVREDQQRRASKPGEAQQTISIRGEMSSVERTTKVLETICPQKQLRDLLHGAITTEDPKLILDDLRRRYLED